jgi:ribonuclease VapC
MIDASAIVAIIADEPGAGELAKQILALTDRFTTPLAVIEAALSLTRIARERNRSVPPAETVKLVFGLIDSLSIVVRAMDTDLIMAAADAADRYGKSCHPASLNLGDCFAYAAARVTGSRLVYKGDDFAQTDLA